MSDGHLRFSGRGRPYLKRSRASGTGTPAILMKMSGAKTVPPYPPYPKTVSTYPENVPVGHDRLRRHHADFLDAYNFARRLKTLSGLTAYEYICKIWTSEPG